MKQPLVSIHCITYNHEKYISQAIEGFLMQKTSFPLEILIGEDCSTDKTRQYVFEYQSKYPDLIKVVTSERNVGLWLNEQRTSAAATGRYMAFCGGDDYWTDPYKLQKQVDFLETHPDYGIVHTDYDELDDSSGAMRKSVNSGRVIPQGDICEELLRVNSIAALTPLVRRTAVLDAERVLEKVSGNWLMGDYPKWLEISRHWKIGYISDVTATYRVLPNSASHSSDHATRDRFEKSTFDIKYYFVSKYGCSPQLKDDICLKYHSLLIRDAFNTGDYETALKARDYLIKLRNHLRWKKRFMLLLCGNKGSFILGTKMSTLYYTMKSLFSR